MERIKIIIISMVAAFVLWANPAQAARIFFEPANKTANVGDTFSVKVFLDTQGSSINAIDLGILYPKLFAATKIDKSGSILSLWVKEPSYTGTAVLLSGGTPGGVTTARGLLATIFFQAKAVGNGSLGFTPASQALLNDGLGTAANIDAGAFSVIVAPKDKIAQTQTPEPTAPGEIAVKPDNNKPQPFEVFVDHDPRVFNNDYFVSFHTTDHETGVDHYEVKEGQGVFRVARSPFHLTDQSLQSTVTVRAYDGGNNYSERKYPGPLKRFWRWIKHLFFK